jgi:hypothetical protein
VQFSINEYLQGRRNRKKFGSTPRPKRSEGGVDTHAHGLTLISKAVEQKDKVKKQLSGVCAGCAAARRIAVVSAKQNKKATKIKRSSRTQYWCRACRVAVCGLCYLKLRPHGGNVAVPTRMGLFSRPTTQGRTSQGSSRPTTRGRPGQDSSGPVSDDAANESSDSDIGMSVFL